MSYSRWSNSRWYTYWSASDSEVKDEQSFAICGTAHFTYKELKTDIQKCLDEVVAKENEQCDNYKVTSIERDELKLYMKQFIEAVERDYEPKKRTLRKTSKSKKTKVRTSRKNDRTASHDGTDNS